MFLYLPQGANSLSGNIMTRHGAFHDSKVGDSEYPTV